MRPIRLVLSIDIDEAAWREMYADEDMRVRELRDQVREHVADDVRMSGAAEGPVSTEWAAVACARGQVVAHPRPGRLQRARRRAGALPRPRCPAAHSPGRRRCGRRSRRQGRPVSASGHGAAHAVAAPEWCRDPRPWFPCPDCGAGLYWVDLDHGVLLVCANHRCSAAGMELPVWRAQQHREDRGIDQPVSAAGWPRPVLRGPCPTWSR